MYYCIRVRLLPVEVTVTDIKEALWLDVTGYASRFYRCSARPALPGQIVFQQKAVW